MPRSTLLRQYGEAAIAAVPHKTDQHGRQAHRERQTPGQLDIDSEEKDQGRYQEFAASNTEQRCYEANDQACGYTGEPECPAVECCIPRASNVMAE